MRYLYVVDSILEYHIRRVNHLGKLGYDILLVERFHSSIDYDWSVLKEEDYIRSGFKSSYSFFKWIYSNSNKDTVLLIPGYSTRTSLLLLFVSVLSRAQRVLLSDSTFTDMYSGYLVSGLKKYIISLYSHALVSGEMAQRYLKHNGFDGQFVTGYDSVCLPLREWAGLHSKRFIVVSRLLPRKNVFFILSVFRDFIKEYQDYSLTVIGDGPELERLKKFVENNGLEQRVKLTGYRSNDEIIAQMITSRALIHAGVQEPWGLVVNEASSVGLPVILSYECGSSVEILLNGCPSGFLFNPKDKVSLLSALRHLVHLNQFELLSYSKGVQLNYQRYEKGAWRLNEFSFSGYGLNLKNFFKVLPLLLCIPFFKR